MLEMGCELFWDHKKPVAKFFCTDARGRSGPGERLGEIGGKVDVLLKPQLLGLFWHEQRCIGETIVMLSQVGTKVISRALGTVQRQAREVPRDGDHSPMRMYHDGASFKGIW